VRALGGAKILMLKKTSSEVFLKFVSHYLIVANSMTFHSVKTK
jgi:hypothetical protein